MENQIAYSHIRYSIRAQLSFKIFAQELIKIINLRISFILPSVKKKKGNHLHSIISSLKQNKFHFFFVNKKIRIYVQILYYSDKSKPKSHINQIWARIFSLRIALMLFEICGNISNASGWQTIRFDEYRVKYDRVFIGKPPRALIIAHRTQEASHLQPVPIY